MNIRVAVPRRGARLACAALLVLSSLPARSAAPEASAYQITPDHAGVTVSGGVLALQEQPLWTVSFGASSSYPLIVNGTVFVTVAAGAGSATSGTQLYALNAQTGAILWGPLSLASSRNWSNATYDGGTVFVLNSDGTLASFDAATGTAGWSVSLPLHTEAFAAAPTASGGQIYVSGSNFLYALSETDGSILWSLGGLGTGTAAPAVGGGGVFFSYNCPGEIAYATNGNQLWQYSHNCVGDGGYTPVYAAGVLYARSDVQIPSLYTLDAASVGLGIRDPLMLASSHAPAVTASSIFTVQNHTLIATDLASGSKSWSFTGDGTIETAPIVIDNAVIVGGSSGMLYALDVTNGNVTWQVKGFAVPPPDEVNANVPLTGLAAADGVLVVPTGLGLTAYALTGPPAPASLTASAQGGLVTLSWGAAAGAATYNIYQGTASGMENVTPLYTGVMGTMTDFPAVGGQTLFYTVKAVSAAGISAASPEASVAVAVPGAPTGLTAAGGDGEDTLAWTAAPGAASYSVYMGTAAGAEGAQPVKSGITTNSVMIGGLTNGTRYYFVVRALGAAAQTSNPSNEASATPQAPQVGPGTQPPTGGGGALDSLVLLMLLGLALVRLSGRPIA